MSSNGARALVPPSLHAAGVVVLFAFLARRFLDPYFPLDPLRVGGVGDFEAATAVQWIVGRTLRLYGELPLWNPYMHTGLPFIGDPYISFFNPFVVAPYVVLDPVTAGKASTWIAVTLTGIGQYWLSRVLRHSVPVAIIAGVVAMTAGTLVARIASGFCYGCGMQHAWMAATLAAFITALRAPSARRIALAALCYALLFHAGNLYYWLLLATRTSSRR